MLNESINTSELVNGVKGSVVVELFDAETNKIVEHVRKSNFIANSGKEYLQYLQRANFKNQISVLNLASDNDAIPHNPIGQIVITDSDKEADPDHEWHLPGNIIGYSNRLTYSGPDEQRGTPNPSLSETNELFTKWVFDWPTHAANGQIASVSWHAEIASYYSNLIFPMPIKKTTSVIELFTVDFTSNPIAYASESRIFTSSGTTVSVRNNILGIDSTFTSISANGIAWDSDNNKLWVISGNQIASYDEAGAVVNGPVSITNRTYRGLAYDGVDLWTTDASNTAYRISTSGSDLSSFTINMGSLQSGSGGSGYTGTQITDISYSSQADSLYIMAAGVNSGSTSSSNYHLACQEYSTNGSKQGAIVTLSPQYNGSRGGYKRNWNGGAWLQYFDIIDENSIIFSAYNIGVSELTNPYPAASLVFKARIDGMGTRVLLPSPFTKTDQQTLRITYQLDYAT